MSLDRKSAGLETQKTPEDKGGISAVFGSVRKSLGGLFWNMAEVLKKCTLVPAVKMEEKVSGLVEEVQNHKGRIDVLETKVGVLEWESNKTKIDVAKLTKEAFHDALSGLFNRKGFFSDKVL